MCESSSCATETMTTACPATGAGSNAQPMDSLDSSLSNRMIIVTSSEEPAVSDAEVNYQGDATMNGVQSTDQTHATGLTDGGTGTTCAAPNIIYKQSQPALQTASGSPHNGTSVRHSSGTPPTFSSVDGDGNSRDESSQNAAASGSPHVVHVHINPGEMFSVRMGDQMQHIQGSPLPYMPGPATVRMVSNNGPPLPMPMQVPPGHMVQQIVDENGILTHVILSPQPTGPHGMPTVPPMTGPPNGPPQQIYSPYNHYNYPTVPPGGYNSHTHHHSASTPPHIHVPQQSMHSNAQNHQPSPTQNHCPSHGHNTGHINHTQHSHMDERAQRTRNKLINKIEARRKDPNYQSKHGGSKVNGIGGGRGNGSRTEQNHRENNHKKSPQSECTEYSNQGIEEKILLKLLSTIEKPKVSEVEERSALIHLIPPETNQSEFTLDPGDFRFELHLSEKGDSKYKRVYSGDATEITLKDLTPATEYYLKVCALIDNSVGDLSSPSSFTTGACEPEKPLPPKLAGKTKTSITLKWLIPECNGANIKNYILEWDQGTGDQCFTDCYTGQMKQHKVLKLNNATPYRFRLYATNSYGRSPPSDIVCFVTNGTAPSQPDPPMLSERFVQGLCISWIRRPNDDNFVLQMEDEATGHGFLPVYNGPDLSYHIKNLRRNTKYKYRLNASNDEGASRWSESVVYRTLPDVPLPPLKVKAKGTVHAKQFKVGWEPPRDNGGADISSYKLQIGEESGFKDVYTGLERDYLCSNLVPGHTYSLRVCCESEGGISVWSDTTAITTQAVSPGVCDYPKLKGKAKANSLQLYWNTPDYNGGSAIIQYEVCLVENQEKLQVVYKGQPAECTVASLLPGRTYAFKARAFNKMGAGPWSEASSVMSGAAVPGAPSLPTILCKSPHSCSVDWEEPVSNGAPVTDYKLEWQQKDLDFLQLYSGPGLQYEAKGLVPATAYNFRVQAVNSAGTGAFSPIASICTPATIPGAVLSVRFTPQIRSLYLAWKEPCTNGSDIKAYNIEISGLDRPISVLNVLKYEIENLQPDTTYKVRVQAVNSVGVGPYSTPVKMNTLPLPPSPPNMECVSKAHNNVKLKWTDIHKNTDLIQYTLEMSKDPEHGFVVAYRGVYTSYKINKLAEMTTYFFRIHATNDTGDGPLSHVYQFSTNKAPPGTIKAPTVNEVTKDSCTVEWLPVKSIGSDPIEYVLQLNEADSEYKQKYRGSESVYYLENLAAKTRYSVRVCAVRQCQDGSGDLMGNYSMPTIFTTEEDNSVTLQHTAEESKTHIHIKKQESLRQITDQQWAIIIIVGFFLISALVATFAQQFVS